TRLRIQFERNRRRGNRALAFGRKQPKRGAVSTRRQSDGTLEDLVCARPGLEVGQMSLLPIGGDFLTRFADDEPAELDGSCGNTAAGNRQLEGLKRFSGRIVE